MEQRKKYFVLSLMMMITIGTQILTLVKASTIAAIFGTSDEIDAFNLASSIVAFLFGFIEAGISTIIIPEYTKKKRTEVDSFITILYGTVICVISAIIILRIPLIKILCNRNDFFVNDVASLMVILLLSNLLFSFMSVTVAFFQIEGRYNLPKIIAFCVQFVTIGFLVLKTDLTILEYTIILSIGYIVNFIIDLGCAIRLGWRYKPKIVLSKDTKEILKRFLPIILSTGVYRLSLMVDSIIAASLGTGGITILNYASQIATMINTIFVGNLLIYIYPKMSKALLRTDGQNVFWKQTNAFHVIVCLMIAGFISVGNEAVNLLFQHGAFTSEASKMVFVGASIYVFGQQINVIRNMIYRYFYVIGNTLAPAQNSVLVSVANITISLVLAKLIGFYGIILGTIVASMISLLFIMIRFHRIIGYQKKVSAIVRDYIKNNVIMLITVVLVIITKMYVFSIDSNFISIFVYGVETVAIYIVLQYILNKKIGEDFRSL